MTYRSENTDFNDAISALKLKLDQERIVPEVCEFPFIPYMSDNKPGVAYIPYLKKTIVWTSNKKNLNEIGEIENPKMTHAKVIILPYGMNPESQGRGTKFNVVKAEFSEDLYLKSAILELRVHASPNAFVQAPALFQIYFDGKEGIYDFKVRNKLNFDTTKRNPLYRLAQDVRKMHEDFKFGRNRYRRMVQALEFLVDAERKVPPRSQNYWNRSLFRSATAGVLDGDFDTTRSYNFR